MTQRYSRLLLIFPPFTKPALLDYAPIGICQLAAYVRQELPNTAIRILDFTNRYYSDEEYKRELQLFEPDIVGISIITLNAPGGYLVAQRTHQFMPTVPVIFGGVHAVHREAECFAHGANYISTSDGEPLLYEVLYNGFRPEVRGLVYLDNDKNVRHAPPREQALDIDTLPWPAYDLVPVESYGGFPGWEIIGSRGCPYRCTFCTNHGMWGGQVRFRSPARIVDEIEHLYNTYHLKYMQFQDDTINVPLQRGLDICNEIIRRGLNDKLTFGGSMRVNKQLVSPELFAKMKEANFVYLGYGVESGSQRVLDVMQKDLRPGEVRAAVKMARRAGIRRIMGYVMIANWGESVIDVMKTWWLVLTTNMETAFSVCAPFPGTIHRKRMMDAGYITDSSDWEQFNITSVTSRTDKLAKWQIYVLYAGSISIQLVAAIFRHGQTKRTFQKLWLHGRDLLRHKRVAA